MGQCYGEELHTYTVNIYRHVIGKNNVIGVNKYYHLYFALILFDFVLRERLENKTDAKI